jgi:ABC-type nickel/cobalt efflux system permease component RcnA
LTLAHPLGNFTINHFTRLEVGRERLRIHFVVDMAEISTFQELQAADRDGDGKPSDAELNAYLEQVSQLYASGLRLNVDGAPLSLRLIKKRIATPAGAGGLPTLRIECDYEGQLPADDARLARRLRLEDTNHRDRIGWREIIIVPTDGISVFDSNVFGTAVTDELRAYPQDMLSQPLDERIAELSFTAGQAPASATLLRARDGRPLVQSRDLLAELIAVPEITPWVALLGLLIASGLGALHALSPGHGKTVVGAYLVGSRGTARHAAFLGLTVTITHTLGVFALGVVTLFASRYIVPERLFPILSLVSGAIVLTIGLTLFIRRLRGAFGLRAVEHHHHSHQRHEHPHHDDVRTEHQEESVLSHSHDGHWHSHGGGHTHTHLPPGADGSRVTWRSLLALGISGGLLPCPSALVVLLSAISLHRVGYGLLLVVAFSLGLACTLTAIGLAFVYAGRLMKRRALPATAGRITRVLPALSALVIACVGAAICYEALVNAGFSLGALTASGTALQAGTISTASVLALGLAFGLKHAVEADHLAAVSTIVSERKSLLSSSLVGGLWGVGHTISLLIAGVVVILLHIEIGERMALALEFGVALMLITLGVNAIRKLMRGGHVHFHTHHHAHHVHSHPHIHDGSTEDYPTTHHGFRFSARPLLVGMIHGLAGSAALMLLVLSTIPSPLVGMAYVSVFGIGSIGGMMLMSALVGLPLRLTAARFKRAHLTVRCLAGLFSLGFGLFMVYEIGFVEGLFRTN